MEETKAIEMHRKWKGKIDIHVKANVETKEDLALAYTPGVADACLKIKEDINESFNLTGRSNQVAVITDGTAILGLGNIGPEAGMPVMEGKAVLFKTFGNIDAIPLCIKTTDTEEIIKTIKILEGNFAGINLEDISAPRCFEIESRLRKELNIPVFHDDQHGTAIVLGAALLNSLKIVNKKINEIKVVINGAGAAGTAICKYLLSFGVNNIIICDKDGIISNKLNYENPYHHMLASITNKKGLKGYLKDALIDADVFIGVSTGNIVTKEMIRSMAKDAIVFPMANPIPEISYNDAKEAGARIVGTGSSKFPNQVNNALVFPGLFRGALDARAKDITDEMKISVSYAIAESVKDSELNCEYILPSVIDKNVHTLIAKRVKETALK